jgi:group II intron reverse transcriptase/maturase
MRTAETVLNIIQERGRRGLPLERLYRHLYNRELYLLAYSRLYANKGAMTSGATVETVDGMSLTKIDRLIDDVRQERYHWTPVRRTYIAKKDGKQRPLGIPTWSDKLLQEVIRLFLEAYYEPQFSVHSHGFRPGRGCHTALQEITSKWHGVKWFIEGDIKACFDTIEHSVLLGILQESIHDNRFLRLINNLLKAGYLEEWHFKDTYSGVPQGGVLSPILTNLVLDRLDKYVEEVLIPAHTTGHRRKTYPPYVWLTKKASDARRRGNAKAARRYRQQAQLMPSRDPNDPSFRRLHYCRYADDWLLGFIGPKAEAEAIKKQLTAYLRNELRLELSQEKTLITHARSEIAHFLGYELHVLHENSKHDHRKQRCINGAIGLRVPREVIQAKCARYMHQGKPAAILPRTLDSDYSIVAQYQVEYVGIAQYYKLAYNLHSLSKLKWAMEWSLARTLAKKHKTTTGKIFRQYKTTIINEHGAYRVLQVSINRGSGKKPLVAHFGGVPLKWNRWVAINDAPTEPVWSSRSELLERLLAQQCELCGAVGNIEVHHIRKLADLQRSGQSEKPKWVQQMVRRRRKSLIVCQNCHHDIHYGRYDGSKL